VRPTPERSLWPAALGMTSLVLGHVALILCLLPVLGVPIAGCGLVGGAAAVLLTGLRRGVGLRWALAGVAVCGLALSVNLVLYRAPRADDVDGPPRWNPPGTRAFVPPPARPDF
jgi:hypothetical protein